MRQKYFVLAWAMSGLVVAGCMRPMFGQSASSNRPVAEPTVVSVRFLVPPEPERYTERTGQATTGLVVDSGYQGFAGNDAARHGSSFNPESKHVALWGESFSGRNVTYSLTALKPGNYTFALLDQDEAKAVQGWIHVATTGTELVDVLRKWRNDIPEQKQGLAYDFELQNNLQTRNAKVFKSFARQLRAFNQLERELDAAIDREMQTQAHAQMRTGGFLHNIEVLLLPGDNSFFRPTTQPAFSKQELDRVRSGEAASKMVLVADYAKAEWKLRHIHRLSDDFQRCKAVFTEEAQRLARRKRYYMLTDHLYHHDRKFVENEMHLQHCLATIDRLNEQIAELRGRRMGLAFVTELFAPEGSFQVLNDEKNDLRREEKVLEAKMHRLNQLFEQANEDSSRRVTLEQDRQWVHRAMEGLNSELARLDEAQKALQTMKDSSRVIHRQGDYRLLASSFVNQDIPFFIRQTVEREALMSIRLQAADNVLVPTSLTDAYHHTGPWARAANPFEFPPAPRQSMQRSASTQPMQSSVRSQSMQRSSLPQPMQTSFRTQPGKAYLTTMKPEPVRGWQKKTNRAQHTENPDCPWLLKVLVPPCWLADPQQ
ncbi:MAG: hypothetical protein IID38_04025 [Planctomycetes bacterium]|nr:hypothetical protein [Planctomycetota bacterium]